MLRGQSAVPAARISVVRMFVLLVCSLLAASTSLLAQRALDREGIVREGMANRYGVPSGVVCGPVAIRVESVRGVNAFPTSRLRRGTVVARVYSSAEVRSIGLAAGWSFIYMDSIARGWRAVVVPRNPSAPLSARRVTFVDHPTHDIQAPIIGCPSGIGPASQDTVPPWWYKCGSHCCCLGEDPGCTETIKLMPWTAPAYDSPIPGTGGMPVPTRGGRPDTTLGRRVR